jgi:PKD repeat protein
MKKDHPASESAFFNPRIFAAFLLLLAGAWLGIVSFASTPSSGTLTDLSGPQNYTAGPFFQANQSPLGLGQLDTGPRCDSTTFPCDTYTLHVNIPASYAATHCFPTVKVTLSWVDTGTGQSDYDLYIYNGTNPTLDGNHQADYQSASSGYVPEVATVAPIAMDGVTHDYTIVVVPFQPTGETVNVKIELLPGPPPGDPFCGAPGFGSADSPAPGTPRYQIFVAPSPDADVGNGEFNIGFNPHTGRIMTMNSGPIWRITPPEIQSPPLPECCEGLWEDKSTITANIGLDPILWTDQKTGRTFVSNSTVGANAVYAYSDNDGDPGGLTPTGWTEFGIAAPNGGADHETIGSGPYPSPLNVALTTPLNQGEAVYYCSQSIVGPAACYRSDTLGASWGPSTLAYTGQGLTEANPPLPGGDCGGLHGHIHVAPDGTAWLPVNQCGGLQGGVFSTDGGITWVQFQIPNALSQQQGADPSIAIDSNNTIYYSYVNNEPVSPGNPPEGHARVVVGHRNGNTVNWTNYVDLGAGHSVRNAAEIEAVGGSPGRAAVGFLGTDRPGDYQAISFPGNWYAFISTTYDGGQTWTTVNATPNDPVQHATGIWQQGGGATDRNLLDFNEITIDDKGRVLYGYSDGCVTEGCIAGTAPNDFVANMRVARQSGGKTLLASYDSQTDLPGGPVKVPKPPCLSGTRDTTTSHLTWKAPDNGGANITQYQIFRGTTAGGEGLTPIGSSITTKFDDPSVDPNVVHYFYIVKAINSAGSSSASNEIDLQISASLLETPCALPGLTILQDGTNDELDNLPSHDVQKLSIGEPYAFAPDKVVFTLKVQSLATLPPETEWPIAFDIGATNYTVQMTTETADGASVATPLFQVFKTSDGSLLAPTADPASNYTADGTITIVVPRSLLGNPGVGTVLNHFLTRIAAVATITPDNMPNNLTPSGSYTIVGNAFCRPNTAPVAALSANPTTVARGGSVTLDGSASSDADSGDTIATYTFNFGDGSQTVTQSTATVNHIYDTAGQYAATLKVTDSRGKESNNTALVDIYVNTPPTAALTASPTSGKSPLSVSFNASGSSDPDPGDVISSYTFTFGDGSASVTQTSATITHTYNNKGTFTARVMVKDSRGATSTNNATKTISVSGGTRASPTPTPTPTATPTPTPKKKPH